MLSGLSWFRAAISFEDYFPLKKGDVKYFYVHHISGTDTLKDKDARSVCRSQAVKGRDIYYFTDESSTQDYLVGPNAFCQGVFYYDHGAFLSSPLSWTHELKEANLAYFDTLFPAQLAPNTSSRTATKKGTIPLPAWSRLRSPGPCIRTI